MNSEKGIDTATVMLRSVHVLETKRHDVLKVGGLHTKGGCICWEKEEDYRLRLGERMKSEKGWTQQPVLWGRYNHYKGKQNH